MILSCPVLIVSSPVLNLREFSDSGIVMGDTVQTWGYEYYMMEDSATPLYILGDGSMAWADARTWCKTHHYELASVHCQVTTILTVPPLSNINYYFEGIRKIVLRVFVVRW